MKTKDILDLLKPIADTFNVAVKELWGIFVRRYIAKGVSEIFTSVLIIIPTIYFFTKVSTTFQIIFACLWLGTIVFIYDAIQLLINPQYFALEDVIDKVKIRDKWS